MDLIPIEYVKVDAKDGYPTTQFPARHGPADPIEGIQYLWDEPGDPPRYYGLVSNEAEVGASGILRVLSGETWLQILFQQIANSAFSKKRQLDQERDACFAAGMPWTFGDVEDIVQTSPNDQTNLLAMEAWAQRELNAGRPESTKFFRAKSNVTHTLTAAEMAEMTIAALAHIEYIYGVSWHLKDTVDAYATSPSVESLLAINALAWPSEGV